MSLISSNKSDVNTWELDFAVEAADFDAAVNKVYQKQKKNITVKGFRKGKATRKMVEAAYGKGVFYEDAANDLINEEVGKAVEDLKLEIVDTPKIEVDTIDTESGLKFKATCVVKPEIEVTDYKGIHAPKKIKEVTDADIDAKLETLRQRNSRMVSVEDRAAEKGDNTNIDFEGFVDGVAFDGGKGENYDLKLGSGTFIPGFEDQIVGKKIGDEFDVTVTFPEDYGVEDLSGKEAVFKCKLNGISVQELPEVDDEFIKDATEFDTVDEYKADTRKKLEEEAEKDAETNFSNAVMDAVIAKVDAPIPRVMFDRRVDDLLRNFDGSLRQQGLNLDLYMQYTGMTVDSLRDTYTERAENEVKLRLALEAIAKAENLDVTEDEVNEKLTEMAASYKMEVEKIKELIPMDEYKKDLIVDKAMELVKDSAVVDNDMPASADAE